MPSKNKEVAPLGQRTLPRVDTVKSKCMGHWYYSRGKRSASADTLKEEEAEKHTLTIPHPADAQVTGPDRVRVAAPAEAVGITYAFASWPEVSLFDTAGLPAAPFRLPIGPP